jgi:hypothetical protein
MGLLARCRTRGEAVQGADRQARCLPHEGGQAGRLPYGSLANTPRGSYDHAILTRFIPAAATSTNPFEPPQYNFNQPPQPQYYNYGPQPPPPNNLAVGALVCGVLGLLMFLCCGPVSFPLNVAAIIMGALSMHPPNKGLAIGGVVCGVLGLLLWVALIAFYVVIIMIEAQNPSS